jgi:hypothetical protein
MQVTGMIADEFLKHYGENAVPIPNSSTADKLSYLHKELQEKVYFICLIASFTFSLSLCAGGIV